MPSQMTLVPNVNLNFFHIAELLLRERSSNSRVAMVTVSSQQPGRPVVRIITRNICAKFEPKMLSLS